MSLDLVLYDDSFFNFEIDSPIDFLQEIHNYNNPIHQIANEFETNSSDQVFPSSPPNSQFQNLSLTQQTHSGNSSNSSSMAMKSEEFQFSGLPCFDSQTGKMMHMSYGVNSLDEKPSIMNQSQIYNLDEPPNFSSPVFSSSEFTSSSGQLRKANSTGDLHKMKRKCSFSIEKALMEETNSKVEPYSAEERKQRIHRYREKRIHRNFTKTIKYACRKTLADNRVRIRGRFARSDETPEPPANQHFIWMNGLCEEKNMRPPCGS